MDEHGIRTWGAKMGTVYPTLTTREQQVLRLVAEDKTDREIGRDLDISERTVRAHVSRIILKLGVKSRVGAAVAVTRCIHHGENANIDLLGKLPSFPGNGQPSKEYRRT